MADDANGDLQFDLRMTEAFTAMRQIMPRPFWGAQNSINKAGAVLVGYNDVLCFAQAGSQKRLAGMAFPLMQRPYFA